MGKKNRTPEENEKHKKKIERILFRFVDITMWGSVIIIGILIYFAPSEADALRPYIRVKSDYTLMFVQSILGIICLNLPGKIEKKWGVKIPSNMLIPFVIFRAPFARGAERADTIYAKCRRLTNWSARAAIS